MKNKQTEGSISSHRKPIRNRTKNNSRTVEEIRRLVASLYAFSKTNSVRDRGAGEGRRGSWRGVGGRRGGCNGF